MRAHSGFLLAVIAGTACGRQEPAPSPPSTSAGPGPAASPALPSESSAAAMAPASSVPKIEPEFVDLESFPDDLDEDAWRNKVKTLEGRLVSVVGCIDPKYRTGPRSMLVMACRYQYLPSGRLLLDAAPTSKTLAVNFKGEPPEASLQPFRVVGRFRLGEVAGKTILLAWASLDEAEWTQLPGEPIGPSDELESSLVEQVLKENPFAWEPYVDPKSGANGFRVKAEDPGGKRQSILVIVRRPGLESYGRTYRVDPGGYFVQSPELFSVVPTPRR